MVSAPLHKVQHAGLKYPRVLNDSTSMPAPTTTGDTTMTRTAALQELLELQVEIDPRFKDVRVWDFQTGQFLTVGPRETLTKLYEMINDDNVTVAFIFEDDVLD